jgi:calcineurin-like phosphoesterase family protein
MSQAFFTADTHFGHANIIRYCNRPWYNPKTDVTVVAGKEQWVSLEVANKRCQAMDVALIANWNSVVGQQDQVYHLGDFCFGKTEDDFQHYFSQLHGRITFIKGNHDRLAWKFRERFDGHYNSYVETEINGQDITLCHYALRVFNGSHYGAWNLYGHSHGTLVDDPHLLAIDVGVDCHGFKPISFEQVQAIMAKKDFKPLGRDTLLPKLV